MKTVADTLGVSRSNLVERPKGRSKSRGSYRKAEDTELLPIIRRLVDQRPTYRRVIGRMVDAGAEAIILGCTEIALLVRPEDSSVPTFDTTALHAAAAIQRLRIDYFPEGSQPLRRLSARPSASAPARLQFRWSRFRLAIKMGREATTVSKPSE